MAKLGSYYGLCPLIDQKNLLGVTKDLEAGHVIVTLGKNIAIKYRLTDQKQIHSWRTKDKFSSPVIYNVESEQYVAVFNEIYIRMWKGDEEYLDKLKKYKFNKTIYTITTCMNKSFVVFNNGDVLPLNVAIDHRKDTSDSDSGGTILEIITATLNESLYIGVMIKFPHGINCVCYVFNDDKCDTYKMDILRNDPNLILMGHTLTAVDHQNDLVLLTLWSDGKLHSYPVGSDITSEEGELFGIVDSLSYKQPVTMVSLHHHYIAMYGADINEEGAILILYNLQFKVSQLKQPLKLFTAGAKLWPIENNLLFCIGQNMAVIPFCLDTEQLSALVGSHRAALTDLDPDICIVEELEQVTWDTDSQVNKVTVPSILYPDISELSKQGLSETMIFDQIIPTYIESKNIVAITACLDYFKDISEISITRLLRFCLSSSLKQLVNQILSLPFSEVLLLPYIRSELDLNNTLKLLQHISYLMSDDGCPLPSLSVTDSDKKLIDWSCVLLDANYQKLLLSKDLQIHETLYSYSKLVEDRLSCLENLNQIEPLLLEIKRGKVVNKNKQMNNIKYSIEQLSLY